MAKKFYFKFQDSERCYPEKYFQNHMKNSGIEEIEVFEAIPEIIGGGIFWCSKFCEFSDDSKDTCGKQCLKYEPRNGKNGRCRYHNIWSYEHGEKITLKQKK